jgi:hypothetical protein
MGPCSYSWPVRLQLACVSASALHLHLEVRSGAAGQGAAHLRLAWAMQVAPACPALPDDQLQLPQGGAWTGHEVALLLVPQLR